VAGGYREYLMTDLQGVGAGVDVPHELLSGDLSNVNYSSYRAGMLGFRNAIDAILWLTLIPMYCRPTWRTLYRHPGVDRKAAGGELQRPVDGIEVRVRRSVEGRDGRIETHPDGHADALRSDSSLA
jgi:hypothetical protein